jgi:hypothetical protein
LIKIVEQQGDGLRLAITSSQIEFTFVIERRICRWGNWQRRKRGVSLPVILYTESAKRKITDVALFAIRSIFKGKDED